MRYKHAVCASQSGFIYIHGGRFGNLALEDDVWRFDAHHNSWLQLDTWGSCKPANLQEHTLVEFNEQLYLFGGQVSASNQENSFWRLDLASNEWHSLSMKSSRRFGTYLGPTNRRGHSAVIYRSSMFIFGGYEDFRGSSAQLWQYDLLNQRWELANLSSTSACHPEPRHSHSAVVHQDSMYIYGGLSNLKPLCDLWRWSWRDRRWFKERTRGRSPGQLHGHTAIQAFDSMFVFGGERRHGRPSRSLWRLNLINLSWQKIRPKGPRPSPTTWHAAIANPLNKLDAANYIVEGADEDARLLLAHPASPTLTSESCFGDHLEAAEEGVCFEGPTSASVVRPMDENNSNNSASKATPAPPKSSSMTLSSALTSRRPTSTKRRLRLSFLKKNKQVRSSIASSLSAANLINSTTTTFSPGKQTTTQTAQRHSIAIIKTENGRSDDVQMAPADETQTGTPNTKILDSLDTDIKQMFQRALNDEDEEAVKPSQPELSRHNGLTRDSMTNSQLSSYLSKSQLTYQTARDQLTRSNTNATNNSTSTLANGTSRTTLAADTSGVVRREHSGGPRNPRPKSEIVRSLIDGAEHLYTCTFAHNNGGHASQRQYTSVFDSNDPLLGKLKNHRMFDRPPTARERRRERHSLDKSKRHTIHQTMTYYNLYFSEEKSGAKQETSDTNTQEESHTRLVRDDLSSSTIKGASCSGAALVGVRDGTHSSHSTSGSHTDQLSSLATTGASLHNSSESRTLCAGRGGDDDDLSMETNQANDDMPHRAQQVHNRPDMTASESSDNTSMSLSGIPEFEEDDMLQYSSPTEPIIKANTRDSPEVRMHTEESQEEDQYEVDEEEFGLRPSHHDNFDNHTNFGKQIAPGMEQQAAHKSASSGYDSIHSSYEHNKQRRPINGHSDTQEDSSVRTESSLGDQSPVRNNNEDNQRIGGHYTTNSRQINQHKTIATTASSTTTDSLALTTSDAFDSSVSHNHYLGQQSTSTQQHHEIPSKSLPSSPPEKRNNLSRQNTNASSDITIAQHLQTKPLLVANQNQRATFVERSARFFSKKKSNPRYRQLCMFVIGGKQSGSTHAVNEPISMWRLYI